ASSWQAAVTPSVCGSKCVTAPPPGRLLQYTFVGDLFMVPDDPLGRNGPHLKDFLRCRSPVSHPLAPAPQFSQRGAQTAELLQFPSQPAGAAAQWQPTDPAALRELLLHRFPGQDSLVTLAIQCNPDNNDISSLSDIILNMQRERAAER
ncbi:hypothetical protein COCON_G00113430, partial [Conger conger]